MIITRYLYREITYTLLALTGILLLVFLSNRFIRFLAQASTGDLPSEFIYQLLALKLLAVLGSFLPLAFFLAILLSLGRLYVDNEMAAMGACGVGVPYVLRRIFVLSLGVALATALLTLFLAPWAERQEEKLKAKVESVADIAGIAAGRFKEFSRGKGIFYVKDLAEDRHTMQGIFVALDQPGKKTLLSSEQGRQIIDPETGSRYILMANGHRYDGIPGRADYTITRFEKQTVRIGQQARASRGTEPEALESEVLWNSTRPAYLAELQLRLSAPLAVILLAPLGVLMSHTTPRQGRYAKLFFALLIYFSYANLLQICQKWVEQDFIPVWLGVWWVHGVVLITVLAMLWYRRRHRVFRLKIQKGA
ncbi:MAG: LPS export ABC transporter permease LptF [Gammaproteobacteria bacterium]|nr:LPS export ABC transporter permease LptF [Gammaproteobacteria bacterium]